MSFNINNGNISIRQIPLQQFQPDPPQASEPSRGVHLRIEDSSLAAIAKGEAAHIDVNNIQDVVGAFLDVYA